MTRNKNCNVNALGIHGPPGVGKTKLIKSIAKSLNREYRMISLGGESDNSVLIGHGHTYIGSCQGRIIDFLRETGSMNGVLMFDEIDKISDSPRGREIIGTLIHLIDYTTNNRFNYDRYLSGIEFDLSKILFVFTYNDPTAIDKIFADRLYKIKVDPYSFNQKMEIANIHVIPQVLSQFNYTESDLIFPQETRERIIRLSNDKAGIRDIKRCFERIVSRINTLLLTGTNDDIIRLAYNKLSHKYNQLPITIDPEDISILLEDHLHDNKTTSDPPPGMYL
jgi:ATP-dependent Lon protease